MRSIFDNTMRSIVNSSGRTRQRSGRSLFCPFPLSPFSLYLNIWTIMQQYAAGYPRKDIYIFLFYFSFVKTTTLKTVYIFVLSCRALFFAIYYINNQIFKHRTIFARFCTICTNLHKNAFCTRNKISYEFCTKFVRI